MPFSHAFLILTPINPNPLSLTPPCQLQDLLDLTDLVRGKLSAQDSTTLGALITVDVHARDVVQELVDAGELSRMKSVHCALITLPALRFCFCCLRCRWLC